MATNKKSNIKTTEEKNVEKAMPKTMKIKMNVTYVGKQILLDGKEYEVDSDLANILLKNKECEKCL